jgi:hypothetical protein
MSDTTEPITIACDDCGADPGDPCRPYCTAEAAHNDEQEGN